jgi:hypothetical protein
MRGAQFGASGRRLLVEVMHGTGNRNPETES